MSVSKEDRKRAKAVMAQFVVDEMKREQKIRQGHSHEKTIPVKTHVEENGPFTSPTEKGK